jgi:hypothetical protein
MKTVRRELMGVQFSITVELLDHRGAAASLVVGDGPRGSLAEV